MSEIDSQGAVWVTAAEIAARDNITPEAVLKQVRKMINQNHIEVERDARGRIKRFDLAGYDLYRERYANPAQTAAKRPFSPEKPTPSDADSADQSYDEARRQAQWLEVRKKKLEMAEAEGNLTAIAAEAAIEAATQVAGVKVTKAQADKAVKAAARTLVTQEAK